MNRGCIQKVDFTNARPNRAETNVSPAANRLAAAAARGDTGACFDLGVAYSTGSQGASCDLVEAHKWFNLAAVAGHEQAQQCRADVAEEMSAREIAEAQRRAREWLSTTAARAA